MVAQLFASPTAAPARPSRLAAPAAPAQTHVLDGRWQLVSQIGAGRWTKVYRARPVDAPSGDPADYVIKLLRTEGQDRAIARASLVREAQVGRDVSHPHLAALLDCHLQRPPYYVVFPHLEGVVASDLLNVQHMDQAVGGRRRLAIPRALWLVRQTAEALAALHHGGWLHGDLKPEHLLVSPQGHATLLDLGLARRLETEECQASQCLAGTPSYLPPESLVSQGVLTTASDVYSLGVTLWELLAGKPPMPTHSDVEIAAWHLRGAWPDLRQTLPHAPRRLARLLRAMLAKQPLRRPIVGELIDWLAELEIETFTLR